MISDSGGHRGRDRQALANSREIVADKMQCQLKLLVDAMGDDVVLDAVVDVAGKDTAFQQVLFGPIGAEADDASGPCGWEAGNLGELVDGGAVDVDAGGSGRGRLRRVRRRLRAGLRLAKSDRCGAGEGEGKEDDWRSMKNDRVAGEAEFHFVRLRY
jgi:hypothetical protein